LVRALPCHGRGREFESRRPRQILKDLSPIWHVTSRYKKVQFRASIPFGLLSNVLQSRQRLPHAGPRLLLERSAANVLTIPDGEGVFGLRRALEEAGAQAVMMSLWSVPDIETQELMTSFYSKWLSGMEKHEALKQAQLEIRDKVKRGHEGRDLPYYWGAFVLVGR
jgi:hypothetical protein